MIISDGSHIVEEDADLKMISVKFDINITGDVVFFAKDKKLVEEYIGTKLHNLNMPLPFGGQDESMNTKVNSIKIREV